MFKAQNGRQYNLAARTIKTFLSSKGISVDHADALQLAARLTGFGSYAAALVALQGPRSGITADVRTWRDLANALEGLDDEQLDMQALVTEGRSASGGLAFDQACKFVPAGHGGLVEEGSSLSMKHPVLLVDRKVDEVDVCRIARQFELLTGEPGDIARDAIRERGLERAMSYLNASHGISLSLGKYVVYSEKEGAYWNEEFGWVGDKASATGWAEGEVPMLNGLIGASDAKLVAYADAVDVVDDTAGAAGPNTAVEGCPVKGESVSRAFWSRRYTQIWSDLVPSFQTELAELSTRLSEKGLVSELNLTSTDEDGNRMAALALHKPDGEKVGTLQLVLRNGARGGVLAASVHILFADRFGGSFLLAEGTSHDTYFATEARWFVGEGSWLTADSLWDMLEEQLIHRM